MKYILRHIEPLVLALSREYGAILVTGPRQVGKTTMLEKLMQGSSRAYVSLDDLNERQLAKTDPAMFLQMHPAPVLIDEVQYAPELFSEIKRSIDKRKRPGAFWLTGSQPFQLMALAQESLAGRAAILHMTSLSQREIDASPPAPPFTLNAEQLKTRKPLHAPVTTPEIFRNIWRGSLPALVSGEYTNRDVFYTSYIQTYVGRDVRDISERIDALDFMRFLAAVACRCAQMVNVHEIAKDISVSDTAVRNWLGILEKSDVVFYLHPYSGNTLKRVVKTPKLYFFDTGLVAFLTKWNTPETLESGAMNGAVFENYVVCEILKSYAHAGREPPLYYYRDRDGVEIDLILEADGVLYPIEIKKTATPRPDIVRGFKALDHSPLKRGAGAVVCMASDIGAIDSQTLIVPAWAI